MTAATVRVTVNIVSTTGSTTDNAIAQDGVPELSSGFRLSDDGSCAEGSG